MSGSRAGVSVVSASPIVGRYCDSLRDATERFATMLRLDPDPSLPAIGIWTVGETAAHVASSPTYFLAAGRGDLAQPEALDDVARGNAEVLASDPERTPRVLADRLEHADEALVAYARTVEGDPIVEPFAGVRVPLSSMLAVELAELLVHGEDVGRAARLPWTIPSAEAALALDGLVSLLPAMVDERRAADVALRCELRVRGGSRSIIEIDHGTLRVEPASAAPVDCRLSVDPVAFLLLSYNRVSMPRPVLRGRLVAWGRRPWRAMRLQTSLRSI